MIKSILKMKCPKCHKGDLFIFSNPYNLETIDKMPQNCNSCGQLFQPEPDFYFRAMYISYGIGLFLFLNGFFVMEILFNITGYYLLIIYLFWLFVLWPIVFRYARVLYIYIFVRYDSEAELKFKTNRTSL